MDPYFYATTGYINTKDVIKMWVKEPSKFHQTYKNTYMTSSLRNMFQYLIVLCCWIYRQKNVECFLEGWVYMLYQIIYDRKIFNWSDLISQQLKINVNKGKNTPKGKRQQFYMYAYLLDGICACNAFPDMDWKWNSRDPPIHIYCKLLEYFSYTGIFESWMAISPKSYTIWSFNKRPRACLVRQWV